MIRRLTVDHLRAHSHLSVQFAEMVTTIVGRNGTGKTTLLEAIAYMCRGRSFRGSDKELLQHDAEWFKITGRIGHEKREVRYQPDRTPSKTIIIDEKSFTRMPRTHLLPLVVFEPDDLRLIHGSPARRRRWCDVVADTLQPGHLARVRRYERVMLQRNAALKTNQELFAWDVALANLAEQIITIRRRVIKQISPLIQQEYARISQSEVEIHLTYTAHTATASAILELLQHHRSRDKATGTTSVGPHRDDIHFYFQGKSAATVASRGETRTIIIASKYAEAQLIQQQLHQKPLVLLDDVLSELDQERQTALEAGFAGCQTILTAVDTRGESKIIL